MKFTNEQMRRAADTIRCLCADMIDRAKSGHPGAPLGMADLATHFWLKHFVFDPADPKWPARDRLVFSGGHASALAYALFHLSGTGSLSMDELKTFRQLGSRCAGHPERGLTPGVEVTTGPLGQGLAMGAGLALAAKKAGIPCRTWVFCGDGDLEEGISHEACSWAGAMKLDSLVAVYDSNGITIEGSTALAMADDAKKRFESYGWKVFECDGHDFDSIGRAYSRAVKTTGAPVLVIAKTTIGKGAPSKSGSASCHGSPLGAAETAGLKTALGFDPEKSFDVGADVYAMFASRALRMHRISKKWRREHKDDKTPAAPDYMSISAALPRFESGTGVSTRSACGKVMNAVAALVPGLVGGSADLGPSNKTYLDGLGDVGPGTFEGRNVRFGIRELAMSAIVNGISAFGGFRGYAATFFVFSDYCKPAIRLAALMKLQSVWVFSHDSFYVGEDGPTHEPVEQLAMLRSTPGLETFRPADARETAYAWFETLVAAKGPVCIVTTRQDVPVLDGVTHEGVAKGAYPIYESGPQDAATILFIATGSEVSISVEAAKRLAAEGRSVRVVSMPSVGRFLAQPADYRDAVVPPFMARRVIVEAGARFGWDRFCVSEKTTRFVTLDRFGASAPCDVLAGEFGFTADNVFAKAKELA